MMFHEIAPKKLNIEYIPRKPKDDDLVLSFDGGKVLISQNGDAEISLPTISEMNLDEGQLQFLFSIDEQAFYLLCDRKAEEFGDYHYDSVQDSRNRKPMWLAWGLVLGFRLRIWYASNRFCGRCGKPMVHSETERAMTCPECHNVIYPSICPSVIVAVLNGDRILLTRYSVKHSPYRGYALVAGYVESGESPEETVLREVMEEVGLKVKNIRYYKSQPWPVSGALLLGYYCEVDGSDQVKLDEDELEAAEWLTRDEVPDREGDISLTSEMMMTFKKGIV